MKNLTKEKLLKKFGSTDFRQRIVRYLVTIEDLSRECQEVKKVPSVENKEPPGPQSNLFVWSARESCRGIIQEANYRLNTLALLKQDLQEILETCSEIEIIEPRRVGKENVWNF